MMYQSKTTKLYYVYYCFRATCFESYTEPSSGTSKNTDPYLAMFKMRCGIPKAYILDKTVYKMKCMCRFAIIMKSGYLFLKL